MLVPTFTHTARNQDTPPLGDAHTNDNTILQAASLFYGGTIYGNLGALMQVTYDRATNHTFLDNTDIRYADTLIICRFECAKSWAFCIFSLSGRNDRPNIPAIRAFDLSNRESETHGAEWRR
jgi:hypothetical protein